MVDQSKFRAELAPMRFAFAEGDRCLSPSN